MNHSPLHQISSTSSRSFSRTEGETIPQSLFNSSDSAVSSPSLISLSSPSLINDITEESYFIREEVVSTEERIEDLYDEFTAKHTDENIMEKELDISGYENVLEATDNDRSNASPLGTKVTKVNIPLKSQQHSKELILKMLRTKPLTSVLEMPESGDRC